MQDILRNKGQTPRVYRNTLFFLYPLESERAGFVNALKRRIAYGRIDAGKNLSLSDDQKREVKNELKKATDNLKESIRRLYRMIAIPNKGGFKEADLGVPTYGEKAGLDQAVYERLRSDGEILERIAALVIKEKYLSGKEYVLTEQLYQSSLKTPGEPRPIGKTVLEQGIAEGVNRGIFGLGELEDGKPHYIRENSSAALYGNEIVISEEVCRKQREEEEGLIPEPQPGVEDKGVGKPDDDEQVLPIPSRQEVRRVVQLKFQIPKGKVSGIMGMMNLLQSKFGTLEIEIKATDGEISKQDYEDKIEETLRQLEIEF